MDTEMLAPRSGETVELIAFSVLVAQCCVPCLRMVLPSEPLNFSLELKREIGKIRQMAAPRSQTRTAITCDKDRQICVTDKERASVQQGQIDCVIDKERTTVRQGQMYLRHRQGGSDCATRTDILRHRQGESQCATRTEILFSSTVSPLRGASISVFINRLNFQLQKGLIKRINSRTFAIVFSNLDHRLAFNIFFNL